MLLAPAPARSIGVDNPDLPKIVRAESRHVAGTFTVDAHGAGLARGYGARLLAPDGSWILTLDVVARTDTLLTARASVPALMPASVFEIMDGGRALASAPIAADTPVDPAETAPSCSFVDPSRYIRPKDFAFFYDGLGRFHLFYTRHNDVLTCDHIDENEKSFGHVWSTDLVQWSRPDSSSLTTAQSAGAWDAAHVWAPTLVQRGPTYYLIYTGVDASGNQSIGCATTTDINQPHITWHRYSAPMFTDGDVKWGWHGVPQQLRDPFVMPDPSDPQRLVMYYSAVKGRGAVFDSMSVGVARSAPGSVTQWTDSCPIYMTDYTHTRRWKTESSLAFMHVNDGNDPPDSTWYVFFTSESSPASIRMLTHAHDPTDPSEATGVDHWTTVTDLLTYLGNDPRIPNLNATEYLRVGTLEYLAGFAGHVLADCTTPDWMDGRIMFMRLHWMRGAPGTPDRFGIDAPVADAEGSGDARAPGPALRVTGPADSRGRVRLRMALPAPMAASLEVYDLAGRSVRVLARGAMAAGATDVEWDGRDAAGNPAPSGVYLVRLSCAAGSRAARATLLR
jgi:hypothetical protein